MEFWDKVKKFKLVLSVIVTLLAIGGYALKLLHSQSSKPSVKSTTNEKPLIIFSGEIRDAATNLAVQNAKVTLSVDRNIPRSLYSDSDGLFHIDIPPETHALRIDVDAQGYKFFSRDAPLLREDPEPIRLTPIDTRRKPKEATKVPSQAQPQPPSDLAQGVSLVDPGFHELLPEKVTVVLRGAGMNLPMMIPRQALEAGKVSFSPVSVGGTNPFSVYIDHGVLFCDTTLLSDTGEPAVEIRKNGFILKPLSWDRNFSSNALEVVNASGKPIFHMIRIRSGVIEVAGIFSANGSTLAVPPDSRLFLYPSWKYPSQFAEDAPKLSNELSLLPSSELKVKADELCTVLLSFNSTWNQGYSSNNTEFYKALQTASSEDERHVIGRKREIKNDTLYKQLQESFDTKYRSRSLALSEELQRRLDKRPTLNPGLDSAPSLLKSGMAGGLDPFQDVCTYLENSLQAVTLP